MAKREGRSPLNHAVALTAEAPIVSWSRSALSIAKDALPNAAPNSLPRQTWQANSLSLLDVNISSGRGGANNSEIVGSAQRTVSGIPIRTPMTSRANRASCDLFKEDINAAMAILGFLPISEPKVRIIQTPTRRRINGDRNERRATENISIILDFFIRRKLVHFPSVRLR